MKRRDEVGGTRQPQSRLRSCSSAVSSHRWIPQLTLHPPLSPRCSPIKPGSPRAQLCQL